MNWFLRVSVEESPAKIAFSEQSNISDLLSCFTMNDCNPFHLPLISDTGIDKSSRPDFKSDTFKDH